MREYRRNLERPNNALARDLRGFGCGNIAPIKKDGAGSGNQKFGQQIETGGFAGAIGPDQRVNVAALNLQADIIDRRESLELFGQVTRLQNDIRHWVSLTII
jgi:hypothetical protein